MSHLNSDEYKNNLKATRLLVAVEESPSRTRWNACEALQTFMDETGAKPDWREQYVALAYLAKPGTSGAQVACIPGCHNAARAREALGVLEDLGIVVVGDRPNCRYTYQMAQVPTALRELAQMAVHGRLLEILK